VCVVIPGGTFGPSPVPMRALEPPSYNLRIRLALAGELDHAVHFPIPGLRRRRSRHHRRGLDRASRREVPRVRLPAGVCSTAEFLNRACELPVVTSASRHFTRPSSTPTRTGGRARSEPRSPWPAAGFPEPYFRDPLTRSRPGTFVAAWTRRCAAPSPGWRSAPVSDHAEILWAERGIRLGGGAMRRHRTVGVGTWCAPASPEDAFIEGSRWSLPIDEYFPQLRPASSAIRARCIFWASVVDVEAGPSRPMPIAHHWCTEEPGAPHPENLVLGCSPTRTTSCERTTVGDLRRSVSVDWRTGPYPPSA